MAAEARRHELVFKGGAEIHCLTTVAAIHGRLGTTHVVLSLHHWTCKDYEINHGDVFCQRSANN